MKSGIYQIRNKKTKDVYIGSSVNIEKRWSTHKNYLNKNKHHSIILQRAWNKYKSSSFVFTVLEECQAEFCLVKEQEYLEQLRPYYNIALSAMAPMTGRKHNKKTIAKFKKRLVLRGKDSPSYGTKWSKQTRMKIIKSRIGQKRTEKTKRKQRMAAIKRDSHLVLLPYIETMKKTIVDSQGHKFSSLSDAAKYWDVSVQSVCDNLKNRSRGLYNGIQFKYQHDKTEFDNTEIQNRWKKKINTDILNKAIELQDRGFILLQIAEKFNVSRSGLQKAILKYKKSQFYIGTR